MSHIRIDKSKALKKWAPVLENMGVIGEDRVEWMSEYAEFHSINENAYVNASNVSGMGAVVAAQPNTLAGNTIASFANQVGSGDVGQNMLPVAMKIAAQTIGLDLVAVKPTPGPKIDLLYIDFRYDDSPLGTDGSSEYERPQVFKFNQTTWLSTIQSDIRTALSTAANGHGVIAESSGGLQGGRVFYNINTGAEVNVSSVTSTSNKQNIVEFLGFSRIDGFPMFKAYRQANVASNGGAYDLIIGETTTTFPREKTTSSCSAKYSFGQDGGMPMIPIISNLSFNNIDDGLVLEMFDLVDTGAMVDNALYYNLVEIKIYQ